MFRKPHFLNSLLLFLIFQIVYYLFLSFGQQVVPFNKYLYGTGFHYIQDTRETYHEFNLFNALSAWDGQWYYRIAHAGYTTKEEVTAHAGHVFLDQYAYAFLPLYPYTIAFVNVLLHNTLLSAFVVSNLLLIGIFFASYYVITKAYSEEIAMKATFLLLLFPLALYYRMYYAEGLFLLLLLWFSHVLLHRRWWQVCFSLFLLYLTKVNGLFLLIPLIYVLIQEIRAKNMTIPKAIAIVIAPLSSFLLLYAIGVYNMQYGYIWIYAHNFWGPKVSVFQNLITNTQTIFSFLLLPTHAYKPSKTEIIAFAIGIALLVKSKKVLRVEHWWIALSLIVTPLLVKNFTSYARYELVVFPFFIYFAMKLKGIWYYATVGIFAILLLYFSVVFINWGWIE